METVVVSPGGKRVIISPDGPTVIIGERINPTGKKRLQEALLTGNMEVIKQEAIRQVEAGADILDVNVGAVGVNEPEAMVQAILAIQEVVDVPLCIDSGGGFGATVQAAALKVAKGRPIVSSVTGEEDQLEAYLPLVAEHKTALVGMTQDAEHGIPNDPRIRLEIAKKIVKRAEEFGIPRQDIIIDCITMPISVDKEFGNITLQAMKMVREELGVNLTLGASNISFGLPDRRALNIAFLPLAIEAGLTAAIVDPTHVEVRKAILASDLMLGKDEWAARWIAFCREQKRLEEARAAQAAQAGQPSS